LHQLPAKTGSILMVLEIVFKIMFLLLQFNVLLDIILMNKEFVFWMLAYSIAQQDIKVMEMEFVFKFNKLFLLLQAQNQVLFTLTLELLGNQLIHLHLSLMKFLM
jgi:hypothetical protein